MEAGDFDMTVESQDLYMGENVGQPYFEPDIIRLRFFGGTSGHWSGRCRALDAHDFTARPYHPQSGWPIAKADLDPYQPAAAEILDLDDPTELPDLALVQAEERLRQIQWRFSPPRGWAPSTATRSSPPSGSRSASMRTWSTCGCRTTCGA